MNCKYTKEQIDFLEKNKTLLRKELTIVFNKEFNCDKTLKQIEGVCKRNNFKSGRDCRFKKGRKPFNFGTKGVMKVKKTSFKKGNRPHNTRKVGSERACSKDGYIYVKIAEPRVWVLKHRAIWEQHNGKIQKGKIIQFKDGNKRNFDINNLECVSRQENLYLNSNGYREVPESHKKTFRLLAKVEVKIQNLKKAK